MAKPDAIPRGRTRTIPDQQREGTRAVAISETTEIKDGHLVINAR